ncbi:chaperonin 10-like protein [Panaeolus papilionaceus]|nr:chaperonin 10-like protein [Panaeolus papilionaceus]
MSTRTQKALFLQSKFGEFAISETNIPHPGPGEVLIKVKAVGLNPADWKIQKHESFIEQYPVILGLEFAGDIEEIGEGVTGFEKGDKVFSQADWTNVKGGFQQYAIALAVTTVKIPDGFTYDEMASIPEGLSTAYAGLFDPSPHGLALSAPVSHEVRMKHAGQPILILGGASSVGQMAIQLARLCNLSPIITTASLSNAEALKELGATHVIDRNLPLSDLASNVSTILGSSSGPLEIAFDAVALQDTQEAALSILAPGGRLALVLPPVVPAPEGKSVIFVVGALRMPQNITTLEPLYRDHVSSWVSEGLIKPNRVEIISGGLNGVTAGLEKLESGIVSRVKLVVRPHETN